MPIIIIYSEWFMSVCSCKKMKYASDVRVRVCARYACVCTYFVIICIICFGFLKFEMQFVLFIWIRMAVRWRLLKIFQKLIFCGMPIVKRQMYFSYFLRSVHSITCFYVDRAHINFELILNAYAFHGFTVEAVNERILDSIIHQL